MDDETIQTESPLTLGLILGGALASRAWGDAVKQLMRKVKVAGSGLSSTCRMQIVFDVPGEVSSPASTGIMFPRQAYKAKERRIYIGIGLPAEPNDDAYGEAIQYLWKAIEEANSYILKKGIPGDLDGVAEVVRKLEAG